MSDIPPRRLFPNEGDAQASAPAPGASYQLNSPPLIGQAEFIQADIACSQCGYNLRGQPRDGRCSECGTPVMDAFRRGMLVYADRNWLIRVRSGVVLFFWGIVVSILLGCAATVAFIAYFSRHLRGGPPELPSWFQIPGTIVNLVSIAFAMLVVYRLTAPEPQPGEAAPPKRSGRTLTIIRLAWVSVALLIINTPVYLMLGTPDPTAMTLPTAWMIYTVVAGGIGSIVYLVNFVLLLLHLRSIARRDRTPALGKLFTLIIWGGPGTFAMLMVGGIAMILMSGAIAQNAAFQSSATTTQVGSMTLSTTISSTMPANPATTMPTTAPFSHHAAPSPMLFTILPILGLGECFGFIVFALSIVAAVQFYRALSRAITHNVGMATAFVVNPPMGAESKPPG